MIIFPVEELMSICFGRFILLLVVRCNVVGGISSKWNPYLLYDGFGGGNNFFIFVWIFFVIFWRGVLCSCEILQSHQVFVVFGRIVELHCSIFRFSGASPHIIKSFYVKFLFLFRLGVLLRFRVQKDMILMWAIKPSAFYISLICWVMEIHSRLLKKSLFCQK